MKRIGITGHQGLDHDTAKLVSDAVRAELEKQGPVRGISSLAEGADQIFAREVLRQEGTLIAVIPCAGYEATFQTAQALSQYRDLRESATETIELDFDAPGEEAYWAAGKRVVELADEVLAVWDGEQSGGLGGTADIVAFARRRDVPVAVVWPPGSCRT
ncbi:MAG TPA: hypothetical protein VNP96_09940 [Solirubrobacterales bacterium]|nr:hypothetical protein [Solirubrobacterales bacterium]